MNLKKTLGVALVALMSMAFASSASATIVTPANTLVTATLKEGTTSNFYPKNAYAPLFIICNEAETIFTTPDDTGQTTGSDHNENRIGVGTNSTGAGSVIMDAEPPSFADCETSDEKEAIVATNENNGSWTAAALGIDEPFLLDAEEYDGIVGIGVPASSATITIPELGGLVITVSPGRSSVVTGVYDNETSELVLDGQLTETPGAPIAQYEATYVLNNGFEINP